MIIYILLLLFVSAKSLELANLSVTPYHIRGVNLGGWMVLEPWIKPSMFYQFLGKKLPKEIAMDSYTFCSALGSEEANKQLREHWKTWITDDELIKLYDSGIDTLRLPVPDWIYTPYEPFIDCYDGALEEIDNLVNRVKKIGNLKILIDLHAVKDSQNGFDNSGKSSRIDWTHIGLNNDPTTFLHWTNREANWFGKWSSEDGLYTSISYNNLNFTINTLNVIAEKYKNEKTVMGIEILNEPWEKIPINDLHEFYLEAYDIIRNVREDYFVLFHDSFRLDLKHWKTFAYKLQKYDNLKIAIDTHIYQAWNQLMSVDELYGKVCGEKVKINEFKKLGLPVIVGEWSLATDNCAMWLNGFQDNLPGYPNVICGYQNCPNPNTEIIDGSQGPFGSGISTPISGMCPVGNLWDNNEEVMKLLALKSLNVFTKHGSGWFFWNFKVELEDRWDYLQLLNKGWIGDINDMSNRIDTRRYKDLIESSCDSNFEYDSEKTEENILYLIVAFMFIGIILGCFCRCRPYPHIECKTKYYKNNNRLYTKATIWPNYKYRLNNSESLPFKNVELHTINE